MTLTSLQIAQINKMNMASKKAAVGTLLSTLETAATTNAANIAAMKITRGTISASTAEASASAIVFSTGLAAPTGFLVEVTRSGSQIPYAYTYISGSKLNVSSASPTAWKVNSGDLVSWVAF